VLLQFCKWLNSLVEFSWTTFFAERNGGAWLEELRKEWSRNYEFVLIDSRTGLTDSGGVCTIQMPDVLVLVFTANDQSLEGGLKIVSAAQAARHTFPFERAPLTVVPLLSRWEGEAEIDLAEEWMKRLELALKPLVATWLPEMFSPRDYLEKVRVPHVPRFSFGEPLPVITHTLTDSNLPGLAYESIARLLHAKLGNAGSIIDPSYQPPRYLAGITNKDETALLALVSDSVALNREIGHLGRVHGTTSTKLGEFLADAGRMLCRLARYSEAEPLYRRALAIDEASYGSDHPSVARDLNNLAELLRATNRLSEAEPLYRRALAIDEASYGPDHPSVAIRLNNLALLLRATNRLSEAEPLFRRALAISEASYGPDHPSVAIRLNNLAELLRDTNWLSEAEPLYRRALAIDEASYGPDHPNVATGLNNLAGLLRAEPGGAFVSAGAGDR
jgi:tetratricopeptide (TPR) repeat protein